jgi:tetratricopeptide (TPR) repeat protein
MSSRSCHTLWVAVLGALLLAAPPLFAQTGDTATNIRTSDFNNKTNEMESIGTQAFTNAQGYIQQIRSLETRQAEGEELSERQAKKLAKAYDRAIEHLQVAIDESPEWAQPRLTLGALEFNRKEYAAAHAAFSGLLEIEPDNRDAQYFVDQCEQQMAAAGQEMDTSEEVADAGGS